MSTATILTLPVPSIAERREAAKARRAAVKKARAEHEQCIRALNDAHRALRYLCRTIETLERMPVFIAGAAGHDLLARLTAEKEALYAIDDAAMAACGTAYCKVLELTGDRPEASCDTISRAERALGA